LYDSNFLANSSKYYSLFVIIVLGLFKKSTTILIDISVGININWIYSLFLMLSKLQYLNIRGLLFKFPILSKICWFNSKLLLIWYYKIKRLYVYQYLSIISVGIGSLFETYLAISTGILILLNWLKSES